MMSYDDYKAALDMILESGSDSGAVSELLVDLLNNYSTVLKSVEDLTVENETLTKNNASLVKANGELFLQVGTKPKEVETEVEEIELVPLDEVLDELIDDRGRIK